MVGFEEARNIVESTIAGGNFARVNHVDLYNNLVLWKGGRTVQTTQHYESHVRPVVNEVRTASYQVPLQTKEVITTYQAPIVTTNVATSNYTTNTYKPFAGATSTKNTKYMFNYKAPK